MNNQPTFLVESNGSISALLSEIRRLQQQRHHQRAECAPEGDVVDKASEMIGRRASRGQTEFHADELQVLSQLLNEKMSGVVASGHWAELCWSDLVKFRRAGLSVSKQALTHIWDMTSSENRKSLLKICEKTKQMGSAAKEIPHMIYHWEAEKLADLMERLEQIAQSQLPFTGAECFGLREATKEHFSSALDLLGNLKQHGYDLKPGTILALMLQQSPLPSFEILNRDCGIAQQYSVPVSPALLNILCELNRKNLSALVPELMQVDKPQELCDKFNKKREAFDKVCAMAQAGLPLSSSTLNIFMEEIIDHQAIDDLIFYQKSGVPLTEKIVLLFLTENPYEKKCYDAVVALLAGKFHEKSPEFFQDMIELSCKSTAPYNTAIALRVLHSHQQFDFDHISGLLIKLGEEGPGFMECLLHFEAQGKSLPYLDTIEELVGLDIIWVLKGLNLLPSQEEVWENKEESSLKQKLVEVALQAAFHEAGISFDHSIARIFIAGLAGHRVVRDLLPALKVIKESGLCDTPHWDRELFNSVTKAEKFSQNLAQALSFLHQNGLYLNHEYLMSLSVYAENSEEIAQGLLLLKKYGYDIENIPARDLCHILEESCPHTGPFARAFCLALLKEGTLSLTPEQIDELRTTDEEIGGQIEYIADGMVSLRANFRSSWYMRCSALVALGSLAPYYASGILATRYINVQQDAYEIAYVGWMIAQGLPQNVALDGYQIILKSNRRNQAYYNIFTHRYVALYQCLHHPDRPEDNPLNSKIIEVQVVVMLENFSRGQDDSIMIAQDTQRHWFDHMVAPKIQSLDTRQKAAHSPSASGQEIPRFLSTFETVLQRYASQDPLYADNIYTVRDNIERLVSFLEGYPWMISSFEEIARVFIDGCVNQPVQGMMEMSSWMLVAQQLTDIEKLHALKYRYAIEMTTSFVESTSNSDVGASYKAEAANVFLREIDKRLGENWPHIPSRVAYAREIEKWVARPEQQALLDESVRKLQAMSEVELQDFVLEPLRSLEEPWGNALDHEGLKQATENAQRELLQLKDIYNFQAEQEYEEREMLVGETPDRRRFYEQNKHLSWQEIQSNIWQLTPFDMARAPTPIPECGTSLSLAAYNTSTQEHISGHNDDPYFRIFNDYDNSISFRNFSEFGDGINEENTHPHVTAYGGDGSCLPQFHIDDDVVVSEISVQREYSDDDSLPDISAINGELNYIEVPFLSDSYVNSILQTNQPNGANISVSSPNNTPANSSNYSNDPIYHWACQVVDSSFSSSLSEPDTDLTRYQLIKRVKEKIEFLKHEFLLKNPDSAELYSSLSDKSSEELGFDVFVKEQEVYANRRLWVQQITRQRCITTPDLEQSEHRVALYSGALTSPSSPSHRSNSAN